jgi:FkbH-like protein
MERETSKSPAKPVRGRVKCLVWDLDNTLWQGILSEGDDVCPRSGVETALRQLDQRGILLSIASKNDAEPAMAKLEALGLADYFLYPQIHWGVKSRSIARIAEALNIGIDAIAFIDDQPFERDEVSSIHPDVLCLDADEVHALLERPELQPRFITDESRRRRQMYRSDQQRNELEQDFDGPRESFLASLGLVFSIAPADVSDLQRLEELVARTNQLNTTGRIYSYAELDAFRESPRHELLVASLDDRYGEYGKIGLALLEKSDGDWTIRAFLMSCRVMSRGVGAVFLNWIINRAHSAGVRLFADMVPNERNRMMYATYRFAGFRPHAKNEAGEILQHDLTAPAAFPDYVQLRSCVPDGKSTVVETA